MKDPKIYLFDEATSALDRKNESIIQNTLEQLSQGKTTVVIAHRLETIKNVDKIYVINDGIVCEEGTFEELEALKGHFFKMRKYQVIIEKRKQTIKGVERPVLEEKDEIELEIEDKKMLEEM